MTRNNQQAKELSLVEGEYQMTYTLTSCSIGQVKVTTDEGKTPFLQSTDFSNESLLKVELQLTVNSKDTTQEYDLTGSFPAVVSPSLCKLDKYSLCTDADCKTMVEAGEVLMKVNPVDLTKDQPVLVVNRENAYSKTVYLKMSQGSTIA